MADIKIRVNGEERRYPEPLPLLEEHAIPRVANQLAQPANMSA